jgi:hypothetical protein
LGIRQARHFGRAKTKFQLYQAATIANLTLLAGQTGVSVILAITATASSPPLKSVATTAFTATGGPPGRWLGSGTQYWRY